MLKQIASLDRRSLALGRITLAALILIDLGMRATDLRAHYSDEGVLSRSAFSFRDWDFLWSLHALSGDTFFQAALFLIAAVLAISMLLGFHTFAATVGSFVLLLSLQARNPLLRDGQDDTLKVLLFWCMFLPCGDVWSFDAQRKQNREAISLTASFGLVWQTCIIYTVAGLSKLQSPIWRSSSPYRVLCVDRYETTFGRLLLDHPSALAFAMHGLIPLELAIPFLLLIPDRRGILRTIAAFLAFGFHFGLSRVLELGSFPYVSLAGWLLLIPTSWWPKDSKMPLYEPDSSIKASSVFSGIFIILITLLGIQNLRFEEKWPDALSVASEVVGLQQWWVVFAPRHDVIDDGWFLTAGFFTSGPPLDLRTGAPLSWDKPFPVSQTFKNVRWRHYLSNLFFRNFPPRSSQQATIEKSKHEYLHFVCKRWAKAHPSGLRLLKVNLYLMKHPLTAGTVQASPLLLAEAGCNPD